MAKRFLVLMTLMAVVGGADGQGGEAAQREAAAVAATPAGGSQAQARLVRDIERHHVWKLGAYA